MKNDLHINIHEDKYPALFTKYNITYYIIKDITYTRI